jgi:hypothetical protein
LDFPEKRDSGMPGRRFSLRIFNALTLEGEVRNGAPITLSGTATSAEERGAAGEVYCVFEVTERKIEREGNRLLIPEIEENSWWTNLDCEAEKVIELYHKHGTIEQFHRELKSDMDVERLPSGKFEVNKIVLGGGKKVRVVSG